MRWQNGLVLFLSLVLACGSPATHEDAQELDEPACAASFNLVAPHEPSPLSLLEFLAEVEGAATPSRVVYDWSITAYPEGANAADFESGRPDTARFHFFAPLAGSYEVTLVGRVDDCPAMSVTRAIEVAPPEYVIALTWEDAASELGAPTSRNDLDLHVVKNEALVPGAVCGAEDCHAGAPEPLWQSDAPAAEGPNPRLDLNDQDGFGPESVVVLAPPVGTYSIYVHYVGAATEEGHRPTTARVQVHRRSTLFAEATLVLNGAHALWHAATLTIASAGDSVALHDVVASLDPSECAAPGVCFYDECAGP